MSLNKRFTSITSVLSLFFILLIASSLNSNVQAQTNDIVVGVGSKNNLSIQISGPTVIPVPPSCISDSQCPIGQRCDLTIRYCVGYISPTPTPTSSLQPSASPVRSLEFCTNDSQCQDFDKCNLILNRCENACFPQPTGIPRCKYTRPSNHQCTLINLPEGYLCTDNSNNYGSCRNGECIIGLGTPTPPPCITTPIPTNSQSPGCTSDAMCGYDEMCDLSSRTCITLALPWPPACKKGNICNHQFIITNEPDGSFCVDVNNGYGTCQNGICIVPSPTPVVCSSDSQCPDSNKCNLTTHLCDDACYDVTPPTQCKIFQKTNHQCSTVNKIDGSWCVDYITNTIYGKCQNGQCILTTPTPSPSPAISPTPIRCSGDYHCPPNQICDLARLSCVDSNCPTTRPPCQSYNKWCHLVDFADGNLCVTADNIAGGCYSGNCLIYTPTPTRIISPPINTPTPVPSGCTSDSQCAATQKCDLASRICVDIFSPTPGPVTYGEYVVGIGNKQRVTIQIQSSISPTPPIISSTPVNSCSPEGSGCNWCPSCYYQNPPCLMPCREGICQHGFCRIITPTPILTRPPSATPFPTTTPILVTQPINPTNTQPPAPRTTGVLTKITLIPVADSSVDEKRPDTTFGTRPILETEGNFGKQVFMKFDLGDLVGKTIKSAKLNIRVANFAQGTQNVRFVDDSNWTENTITYNTRPATGDIIGKITSSGQTFGRYVNITLEADELSGEDGNLTLEIESPDKWPFHLFSRNSNFRPQLIVEYLK